MYIMFFLIQVIVLFICLACLKSIDNQTDLLLDIEKQLSRLEKGITLTVKCPKTRKAKK